MGPKQAAASISKGVAPAAEGPGWVGWYRSFRAMARGGFRRTVSVYEGGSAAIEGDDIADAGGGDAEPDGGGDRADEDSRAGTEDFRA